MNEMLTTIAEVIKALEIEHKASERIHTLCMRQSSSRTILHYILHEVLAHCGCRSGSIVLVDNVNKLLVFDQVRGPRSRQLQGLTIPISTGIVGWVVLKAEPVWAPRPSEDPRFNPKISLDTNVPAHSIICVPVLLGKKVFAAMEIIHSQENIDFKKWQFDVAQKLALLAGRGIQNVNEVRQGAERVRRLNALVRVSNAVNSQRELSKLLSYIANSATRLLKSEAGSIILRDETTRELVFEATDSKHAKVLKMRLASGTGIVGAVIDSGETRIIEDFQKNSSACKKVDEKTGFTTHSALCVPIKLGQHTIGALEVLNRTIAEPFSMEDIRLFEALADLSAIAIENTRLYATLSEKIADLEKRNFELQQARAQLMKSEKLAIIGEMAAGMSHEIRNIITPIQLIVESPPSPKDIDPKIVAEEYKMIAEQIARAAEMTSGLLTFSRKEESRIIPLNLNEIVQKCVSLVSYRFKQKSIILLTKLASKIVEVHGIASQLQQVVINLINNAEAAIDGTGRITVSTGTTSDAQVFIAVKDTGCGISDENMGKIFEPFFTTKLDKVGTGLGLSICANIINQHGGTIRVNSKVNRGTTFKIVLPCKCQTRNRRITHIVEHQPGS